MRRTKTLAGLGGVLVAIGAPLIAPQAATWPAAASPHVAVAPSASPAFVPPSCGATGTPAYNYPEQRRRGRSADRRVGGHLLRLHHRECARQQPRRARLERTQLRLPPVHQRLLGVDRAAEPVPAGSRQHPDLARRLQLRRPLGDVLRRGAAGPRLGHRLRLPGRGHRRRSRPTNVQFSDVSNAPVRVPGPGGSIDPSPIVDPSTGHRLPRLEAERRGLAGLRAYVWSPAAQRGRDRLRARVSPAMLLYNNTVSYPWETTVEDPSMVCGRRRLLPRLLGRRIHQHRLLGGHRHLQRAARPCAGARARS